MNAVAVVPHVQVRWTVVVALCCAIVAGVVPAVPAGAQTAPQGAVGYAIHAADASGAADADGLGAVSLDGSNGSRLSTGSDVGAPQWAPDGSWLAFTEAVGETTRPAAVRRDGQGRKVLAEEGRDPTWSTDGTLLVWASAAPSPALVITRVQSTQPELVLGETTTITLPHPVAQPRLSPDGQTVAFRMQRSDGTGADLWSARLDGSSTAPLTSGIDVSTAGAGTHSWSPDGGQLVVLGSDPASRGLPRAYLVNADGTGQRLLFPGSRCEYQHRAVWAPHGEFLAVLQSCQSRGIFIVTPDGEALGRVGAGAQRFGGIEFSADAALLYAAAKPDTEASGRLYAIPLDGSTPQVLTDNPPAALQAIDVVTTSEVTVRVVYPPRDPDSGDDSSADRPDLQHACPVRQVPYADFLDVSHDSVHRLAIDCMAWWEVVRGVAEYAYAPAEQMTRAQMASLLVRMIDAGGVGLAAATTDHFDDDDSSVHHDNINRLAEAGVLRGTGGRRFSPNVVVRRDHMATFIVAAYEFASSSPAPAPARDYFGDDNGNLHERSINAAAEAGFVAGVGDGLYAPSRLERRDQAASRAARVLDALVEQGTAQRPPNGLATVTRIVDGDTFLANVPGTGTVRVRLIGVQAPESGTCNARPARRSLRDLILDKQVRLSSDDASSIGKTQRPLRFAEVYTDGGWLDVGGEQLRRGHALWLPKVREPRNNNRYQLLVREAMANRGYLWNPLFCGRGPDQAAQLRMWVESNPSGPDRANPNAEWVRIHNVGTTPVDLAGWQLRDSSLRRPLQFIGDSVVAPGETMQVHVGSGTDERLVRYWGWSKPLFTDAERIDGQWIGDGAYLQDTDGDIRASFIYPCIGECTDALLGNVEITRVTYDPPGDADWANGEAVTITNTGTETVSLYGYQLRAVPHVYDFPVDSAIAPGESLNLYSGRGDATPSQQHWGYNSEILDDVAGMVVLRTYDRIRVACRAWGGETCD